MIQRVSPFRYSRALSLCHLYPSIFLSFGERFSNSPHLLHVVSVVLLDGVPGPDWVLQLLADHHSRPVSTGSAHKRHDAGPRVGEALLEQSDGHG